MSCSGWVSHFFSCWHFYPEQYHQRASNQVLYNASFGPTLILHDAAAASSLWNIICTSFEKYSLTILLWDCGCEVLDKRKLSGKIVAWPLFGNRKLPLVQLEDTGFTAFLGLVGEESTADVYILEFSKHLSWNEITFMTHSNMTTANSEMLEGREKTKSCLLMYSPESTSDSEKAWTSLLLMSTLWAERCSLWGACLCTMSSKMHLLSIANAAWFR